MSFFWRRLLSVPEDPSAVLPPSVFFYRLPTLETADLVLRKPAGKDAKDIFRYASDPEVARYVLWEPHRSISETKSFIRFLRSRIRSGYPSSWVVVLKETGSVIGTIGFIWYSEENRSAELGYSFSREYWNHGYATQALKSVIDASFTSLPLNRLEAQHDLRNPASGRVMEKCGLRQEGILRNRIVNKGEYIDVALYAILRSDWENAQR
ncbi:MAG: GNAT family N-acetyltransferase [Clostridia bacterium]|nr:GNAT family N-acetyltransferase [Clostridia bacterium]